MSLDVTKPSKPGKRGIIRPVFRRAGTSDGDFDRIEFAPLAQGAILDAVRHIVVQVVHIQLGEFGTQIDLACPPAHEGLMQADLACNEFERKEYVLEAGGHGSVFSSKAGQNTFARAGTGSSISGN